MNMHLTNLNIRRILKISAVLLLIGLLSIVPYTLARGGRGGGGRGGGGRGGSRGGGRSRSASRGSRSYSRGGNRHRGSVRHSNRRSPSSYRRSSPSRYSSTPTRTRAPSRSTYRTPTRAPSRSTYRTPTRAPSRSTYRTPTRAPSRSTYRTTQRPIGTPARRPAYARHERYSHWNDARRDYYRYRTANHLIRLGAVVATYPRYSTPVVVSGSSYYYYDGVYYAQEEDGYVIVPAPVGAIVRTVPKTTTVVYAESTPYYYDGGNYYVTTNEPAQESLEEPTTQIAEAEEEENYKAVKPPVGVTVPYLPNEAMTKSIGGKKYFVYADTYYRPFASDGDTIYMVVENPEKQPSA